MTTSRRALLRASSAVLLLPIALAGCQDDGLDRLGGEAPSDDEVTLKVSVSNWSGWTSPPPGYKAPVKVTTDAYRSGDIFRVMAMGEVVTFTVEVRERSVHLKSTGSFYEDSDGMGDAKENFRLRRGGRIELATPTMDAATNVTIEDLGAGAQPATSAPSSTSTG